MATFDFSPMLRSTVGFDQLPAIFAQALEREDGGFPPSKKSATTNIALFWPLLASAAMISKSCRKIIS